MTRFIATCLALLVYCGASGSRRYDVCVYGATSAGVVAAYTAAMQGLDVVLVEPGTHIGGLTAGGLGYTDIGNKQVSKGVAHDFYRRIGSHYGSLEQWIFEPHVADSIMRSYLDNRRINLITNRRIVSSHMCDGRIGDITVESSDGSKRDMRIMARCFIDCSYEGDLMARSGVSYSVGRESNSTYGETLNGVELMTGHQFPDGIDPYVEMGNPKSGLLWGISSSRLQPDGTGDGMVQAYNYRICLTDSAENMIPITKPAGYDASRYDLLARLIEAQPQKTSLNDYFIWSLMPNRKTDINNRNGFSTDMIGMNHGYPEGGYALRDSIVRAHEDYTRGLLYFMGHDPRVPSRLRGEMLKWGYPKDEYPGNGHWTPQLYVRECRRMVGMYVATQADCEGRATVDDGVAMAAYQMDSHNCQRIVVRKDGRDMVKNEGNVEVGGGLPYPISYRSLVPRRGECRNLLVPVACSASHIAYGSIRMEPVFMVLGQACGIAAAIAVGLGYDVQDVSARDINLMFERNPYMDGTQPDVLVDDNSGSVTRSAGWDVVNRPGGYGLTYLSLEPCASAERVTYSIDIPSDGEYSVYCYVNMRANRAARIPFELSGQDAAVSGSIDVSAAVVTGQTSGKWLKACDRTLRKGRASFSITNAGVTERLCADAVLLIKNAGAKPNLRKDK